jgi:hypothetical protein
MCNSEWTRRRVPILSGVTGCPRTPGRRRLSRATQPHLGAPRSSEREGCGQFEVRQPGTTMAQSEVPLNHGDISSVISMA